jgi:hypothetical protein
MQEPPVLVEYCADSNSARYFSHVDPASMSPDAQVLGDDRAKKNRNSGDQIPAYLVNLLLALKPFPKRSETEDIRAFVERGEAMLRECATLILEKFPDSDPLVPYVHERFHRECFLQELDRAQAPAESVVGSPSA